MIHDLQTEGCSLRQIAQELNDLNIKTPRQNLWHPATISRILYVGSQSLDETDVPQ